MATSISALEAQFELQTRLFNNATAGVTEAESHTRDVAQINHIKWIAGHVLNSRVNLLSRVTGLPHDESYAVHFARGKELDTAADYPSIDEITGRWRKVSPMLAEAIGKMPESALDTKAPVQTPIHDDTIRGLIAFLMSHEAYHIGQLGLLRKMIGKDAMTFN